MFWRQFGCAQHSPTYWSANPPDCFCQTHFWAKFQGTCSCQFCTLLPTRSYGNLTKTCFQNLKARLFTYQHKPPIFDYSTKCRVFPDRLEPPACACSCTMNALWKPLRARPQHTAKSLRNNCSSSSEEVGIGKLKINPSLSLPLCL